MKVGVLEKKIKQNRETTAMKNTLKKINYLQKHKYENEILK
jgi:hypothetical protein